MVRSSLVCVCVTLDEYVRVFAGDVQPSFAFLPTTLSIILFIAFNGKVLQASNPLALCSKLSSPRLKHGHDRVASSDR